MSKTDELAALRSEVGALREEIRQLRETLALGQQVHHHHYPPAAPLMPNVQPGLTWPYTIWCGNQVAGAAGAPTTVMVSGAGCADPVKYDLSRPRAGTHVGASSCPCGCCPAIPAPDGN